MELDKLKEGVEAYGSPTYFFDLDLLKSRIGLIREKLGGSVGLCYAMKANPFLVRELDAYVDRLEVCSPGEYEICHEAGISPDKIVISGVNKTYRSMERIMELGDGRGIFTIESPKHYEILSELCRRNQKHIDVLIRLSSGNQFGVDRETLEAVLCDIMRDEWVEIKGIHYYSGTQKKLKKAEKELKELREYLIYLSETYGVRMEELEYGPGLSVSYFEGDEAADAEEELGNLCLMLKESTECDKINVELGRFIAAGCGYYATSVVDTKTTDGHNYCIVDGGIHQLNYYGQMMGMKKPRMKLVQNGVGETEEMSWCVFGSLCTVNDVMLKDVSFPKLKEGDYFIFENCGAYSVTEGMSLFLSRDLPQIVFYSEEKGFKPVRGVTPTYVINSYEED